MRGKPDITAFIEREDYNGMATSKDARGANININYGMDTKGEKEKRTSKEKWMEGVKTTMTR